ncbi:MAG: nodulation protein NfeD [Actinobacteria bacterium]|nr:nodulation protein NfeD [Actinomycetota bacterium]MBV9934466.1 nodulation protein NfeD [Actinomycetota bacterium]
MRRLCTGVVVAALAVLTPVAAVAASADSVVQRPVVRQVNLTGVVDPPLAHYVEHAVTAAGRDHVEAVLVRIDTPGGLDSSMRSIIKSLLASPVPVVCWVGPSGSRAASAGAFILMGCPKATMAPGTNVGAAHPVGFSGEVLSEKITNDAAGYMRSLAERWHRNADWGERAVRQSVSISADEALRIHVIDAIAPTKADALRAIDTGGRIETARPGVIDAALHDLIDPNLAFVFLIVGLALLVFEVFHPGAILPGLFGALLFIGSLVILGMLPVNLAGFVLLLASVAFFVVALKVPGHGLPEAAAITCLVLGGLFLFDPSVPNARVSRILLVLITIKATIWFTIVLRAAMRARKQPVKTGAHLVIGTEAVVVTPLEPTGTVRVQGEEWTAHSAHGPIPAGAAVRVVHRDGLTLEVSPTVDTEVH